jgi:acetylornithine deacetylase/succinyl-diaminopimelate desuccinylase-like protein
MTVHAQRALLGQEEIRARISGMLPEVLADLERMVAIPSVAFPGYPPEPVHEMAAETLRLFQGVGFTDAVLMEVASGYPPVYGEIRGPEGSPVVMLYGHYDVQPAPPEQGWTTDPWTATRKDDERIYGRGAADDKAGVVIHLGTLMVFEGKPPCTVRLIVEGMEETASNLEAAVEANPDLFDCNVFVICDSGNLRVGEPTLTTAQRGDVACVVTVRTLEHPLHSGVFGGPAPDAMMALARLLASLHDDEGNVVVEGVTRFDWDEMDMSADDFSASADLLEGVRLTGSGSVGSRLWSGPSISAIGIDMTTVDASSNVLIPAVRAKISMRIAPGSDPVAELDALARHLETHAPWGAQVTVQRIDWDLGYPFRCATDGPGYAAARRALEAAFGRPAGEAGSGGSIPLLQTLRRVAPEAEFILWGPEDMAKARIHASDESVDPAEIERMIVAQAVFLEELAPLSRNGGS